MEREQPPKTEITIAVKLTVRLVGDDGVPQEKLDEAVKRDLDGIRSELSEKVSFDSSAMNWNGYVDDNASYFIEDVVGVEQLTDYEF